jgi:hypothetical protein
MLALIINGFEVKNFQVVQFCPNTIFRISGRTGFDFRFCSVQRIFFPMLALIINGFEVKNFQVVQFCPNTIFRITGRTGFIFDL